MNRTWLGPRLSATVLLRPALSARPSATQGSCARNGMRGKVLTMPLPDTRTSEIVETTPLPENAIKLRATPQRDPLPPRDASDGGWGKRSIWHAGVTAADVGAFM